MSILYHDGNRRFQDQFASRRIADRLEEKLTRTAFTADDKAFIESRILFFLATADAAGRPTCNHKGGAPGVLYRADNLQDLTAADVERLESLGVSRVVDLRTAE